MSTGSKPLRVLILGCGNIAGGFDEVRPSGSLPMTHAGAFRRHGDFELLACVDPDEGRRRAFAKHWNVAGAYKTIADVPDDINFDMVSICSPTAFHGGDISAAIARKPKLIFCEKPVTATLAGAEAAVRACEEAGVLLAVNHTRRWAPDIQELAEQIMENKWGSVRSVAASYNKGVLNNGAHMMDLLLGFFGPLSVNWAGVPVADFWPDDPTIPATLTTKNGVAIQLSIGHAADYAVFELSIITERGIINMEDGGLTWRVRSTIDSAQFSGYKVLESGSITRGRYDQAMLNAVNNLHAAVRHGAPLLSTGKSALAAHQLCDQIRTVAVGGHSRNI